MYYYIKGKVAIKQPAVAVIDVGGVGYELRVSLSTSSKLREGGEAMLYTYFHVREDIQCLYGFADLVEKELFLLLTSVSGVGTATALMILSYLSPEALRTAILSEDAKVIQSVKGVGAKTAQKIVIELKDKVLKIRGLEAEAYSLPTAATGGAMSQPDSPQKATALEALVTLGVAKNIAEKSLETVIKKHGAALSVEDMIKLALSQ